MKLCTVFLCAQAAEKVMVPRRYGKMVLLSSGAARGYPARVHYSAAKAGIQAMTRALALELGPSNINVNAVAPGLVETRMPQQHAEWLHKDYEAFEARVVSQTALRRVGTPEEHDLGIVWRWLRQSLRERRSGKLGALSADMVGIDDSVRMYLREIGMVAATLSSASVAERVLRHAVRNTTSW